LANALLALPGQLDERDRPVGWQKEAYFDDVIGRTRMKKRCTQVASWGSSTA
jgi:hypothetical protein